MHAYDLLTQLKAKKKEGGDLQALRDEFAAVKVDLGYGLLLKKYTDKVIDATPQQIDQAMHDSIPKVAPLFLGFRLMVGLGVLFLFIFTASFYFLIRKRLANQRWLLRLALISIPLPWVAIEAGWIVAEYGRQPWTIAGILPTHLSVSTLSVQDLYFSLTGFMLFYTSLLVVELYLIFKYARLGPSALHTGKYHFETA